jgi:hypothetical protein
MDDLYSKNQCVHEIIDATGVNSIVSGGIILGVSIAAMSRSMER